VKFEVVNPTNQNYTFLWTCEDVVDPKRVSEFVCHTQNGIICSGKRIQMSFEFTSVSLGIVESFWKFQILEQSISVPFLLVGHTHDPNVTFDRSHINFRCILVGQESTDAVKLFNGDDEPVAFSFVESSCRSEGSNVSLIIEPLQGTIPPKSSIPVVIHFTPKWEKEFNFNVVCNVKRKMLPLTLNVKAEGFCMNSLVLCEDSCGVKTELSSTSCNKISFGQVQVSETVVRSISIVNVGRFAFDFVWELKYQASYSMLTSGGDRDHVVRISPLSGGVGQGDKVECLLTFCPPQQMSLKNCELFLKISHGPRYSMRITGSGVLPGLQFSTKSHNFGPCFIYRPDMPVQSTILKLTNNDTKAISIECLYQPSAWLVHNFEACSLPPQQTIEVKFSFYPREAVKYREVVTFEINGLSQQNVEFLGQGTELKVEVADPRQKIVKFGALRVGQTLKKLIPVVNNSAAPLTFCVTLNPATLALQEPGIILLSPTDAITLQPKGGMAKVEVTFSPNTRVTQFCEEVHLECAGLLQTLFVITGSCQGLEISLDTESIPFGAVVQNSSSIRQFIMNNTGDIGARFKWDATKLGSDFTLSPLEGYIAAGMDVQFDVTFHPQEVTSDIRCENIRCQVEGLAKPLHLTLTGSCVGKPAQRDVHHFTTHVRQPEVKGLHVPNHSTSLTYNLRPVIDGAEYFSGPETLIVPPQSTRLYELTYHPLTMTADGKKHMGSVFFPLPDGQGLMYYVSGTAEPPKPNGKVCRDVPCKTTHIESLAVQNWLKKSQRFRAKIEYTKPEKLDAGTTIKGLEYIDVPGLTTKAYKLAFHSYKECQLFIKVTFVNEQTAEYQYYEVQLRAVRPGVISVIQLSTLVRQHKQHMLRLENPLTNPVTFTATCNLADVQMPGQLSIPALSEGTFSLEYFPLKAGTTQGKLELTSTDLGLYLYDVELKALPASPEKALNFRTFLGSSQTLVAKFLNYAKHKTDYICKLDHSDYHVDKTVTAAPAASSGTEVLVEVIYEPSSVGESQAMLCISSTSGGDYIFPLAGVCTPPKPQGPFVVKAGSSTAITFRNVFGQTMTFQFHIDNPLFHISKPSESIRPHKEHRIVIAYDGSDSSSRAPVLGRMIVSCARSLGTAVYPILPNTQWTYYLKGITQ
jgi:hydrocephalus-inducing protein